MRKSENPYPETQEASAIRRPVDENMVRRILPDASGAERFFGEILIRIGDGNRRKERAGDFWGWQGGEVEPRTSTGGEDVRWKARGDGDEDVYVNVNGGRVRGT